MKKEFTPEGTQRFFRYRLRSAAGGRNEETYSKYAEGIRKISIRAVGSTSEGRQDRQVIIG
jgi:hypothetical protein